jgi:rod shape-determining protein MreC
MLMPIVLCVVGIVLGMYQSAAKKSGFLAVANGGESKPNAEARTDAVSYLVQRILFWPQRLLGTAFDAVGSFGNGVLYSRSLNERVADLESELARTSQFRDRIVRLESEITRLRDLQGLPHFPTRSAVPCDIVGYFPSQQRLMLNVGARRGVKAGAAVVAPAGLVGQVVEVTPTTCFVNLMTHPDFSVGGRVQRNVSQEAGIASGQGSQQLLLSIFNEQADVRLGDYVTTSGLSDVYPEGILIGRITWLDTNKDLGVKQALIRPSINLAKIRHVVVLSK